MSRIVGVVNDRLWPLLPLKISGVAANYWVMVDTGFEGHLMVSDAERPRLRVARTSLMAAGTNADGTSSLVPVGRVILDWFGTTLTMHAHVPNLTMVDGESYRGDPIVGILGLFMMQGQRLTIDFYPGREVVLEAVP